MKILLFSSSPWTNTTYFYDALSKYSEVYLYYFNSSVVSYSSPEKPIKNNMTGRQINPKDYDIVFALDHGCIPQLDYFKKVSIELGFDKKIGCQILDYPSHLFKRNKNYNERVEENWVLYSKEMENLDFFVFNQQKPRDYFSEILNKPCEVIRYPFYKIDILDYQRKNFVLYVGRFSQDKGVHTLITALGLIENCPKLITICDSPQYDFKSYADYLKVPYENITSCSEEKKWRYFHECAFTVFAGDAKTIPPLMITEGLSIGRTSVCFDYPEYRKNYLSYISYIQPNDLHGFSESVDFFIRDIAIADSLAKGASEYFNKERTYEAWASNTYNFFQEIINA